MSCSRNSRATLQSARKQSESIAIQTQVSKQGVGEKKTVSKNQKQLEALYHDIDGDLVDREKYEAVSRRLFPRRK